MVPALVQPGSDTDRCRPGRVSARGSQSLRKISGARLSQVDEEGRTGYQKQILVELWMPPIQ